jgi:hypothetical protein
LRTTASTVEVDGRSPEARGVVWLPRTPGVGEGAAVDDDVAAGDGVVGVVAVGGADCGTVAGGDTAADGETVCAVGRVCAVPTGVAFANVGEEPGMD